jgi:hypothetical protein
MNSKGNGVTYVFPTFFGEEYDNECTSRLHSITILLGEMHQYAHHFHNTERKLENSSAEGMILTENHLVNFCRCTLKIGTQ